MINFKVKVDSFSSMSPKVQLLLQCNHEYYEILLDLAGRKVSTILENIVKENSP